jgi:hypothetical protein
MTSEPLTCDQVIDRLHDRLDGSMLQPDRATADHLAGCRQCRERFRAADRLLACFPPRLPADFATGIVRAVAADRAVRRARRLTLAWLSLAAGLLAAVGLFWPRGEPAVEVVELPLPRIEERVNEATERVKAWAGKVASAEWPELPAAPVQTTWEPARSALVDAGRGVASGVEPLTQSARRAAGRFWRDLPVN